MFDANNISSTIIDANAASHPKVLSIGPDGEISFVNADMIDGTLPNVELNGSMLQMLNQCGLEIPNTNNTLTAQPQTISIPSIDTMQNDIASLKDDVAKMQENLKTFMEAQPAVLERLMTEMNVMKRGMNLVVDALSGNKQPESTPAPPDEDFTSCEIYKDIGTADELKKFEEFVKEPISRGQMMRFIKKSIPICSFKDGRSFFTTVFRFLIDVALLLPYTWKIASASKNAFKTEFPTFVAFVSELVMKEYSTMKISDIEKAFSERMQYKAIDHKRKAERIELGKGERKTSTRTFAVRGQYVKNAENDENRKPNEEEPNEKEANETCAVQSTDTNSN